MSAAGNRLRSFIERVERLEAEIKDLNGDKSEIYKEARGEGYDVKTMRKVVAARRLDPSEREEADALFDLYMTELAKLPEDEPRARTHARVENVEEFPSHDPETGEITQSADMAVGLAGPACAQDAAAANTKPAPISNPQASSSRQADSPASTSSPEPGTNSGDGIPAFLRKPKSPLRPHCLNPDSCAGYGSKHCHACLKARDDATVAA
ncbi:MAG TPA: DUF2312 domain-containing protein [Pararhizobium sp.]|nr:DUF2312 domain-containing protein [Pararhizobium sp.]